MTLTLVPKNKIFWGSQSIKKKIRPIASSVKEILNVKDAASALASYKKAKLIALFSNLMGKGELIIGNLKFSSFVV